jgi:uncharacterized protein
VRIAIVSDSHIRHGRPQLSARLVDLLRQADMILHAGDFADATGLSAFKAIGPEVIGVAGNVDTGPLVSALPEFLYVETPAGTIAMMHILPHTFSRPKRAVDFFLGKCDKPLAVIHGHTHCPEIDTVTLSGGRTAWIINPGSVTRSRGKGHTMVLLDIDDGEISVRIESLD